MKCNSNIRLLRYLARLGVGFDCASWGEMKLVLNLGVDPSRIIFAHPCKAVSALQMASRSGVPRTTFDNVDELEKIKDNAPNLRLLLRIFADDDTALVSLGNKFGAPLDTTKALLLKAKDLGLVVDGVSFHVGMYQLVLNLSRSSRRLYSIVANRYRIWSIECRYICDSRTKCQTRFPTRETARVRYACFRCRRRVSRFQFRANGTVSPTSYRKRISPFDTGDGRTWQILCPQLLHRGMQGRRPTQANWARQVIAK